MGTIFGALRIADSDYVLNATPGQRVIYEEAQRYVAEQNAALNLMLATFVEGTTENFKMRYKLPGDGKLQRRGGLAQSGATKVTGEWDVAFPIDEYGDQVAGDDVSLAYMTAADLDRHIQGVTIRNINTVRYEMLRALFQNTARTFNDPIHGDLTIQPLANSDSVVYPPVVGSETAAADNHYLAAGYAGSAISDTNDPIANIVVPELVEHFGQVTGGSRIVAFINGAQAGKVMGLTQFVEQNDTYVRPGDNTALPVAPGSLPGVYLGRHAKGAFIQQWDWIPDGYIFAMHMDAPKPLMKRRDPAATGLAPDLQMVSTDAEYPFRATHWRHRFGFGVANRLNGVLVHLTAGAFAVPTAYA